MEEGVCGLLPLNFFFRDAHLLLWHSLCAQRLLSIYVQEQQQT